MQNLVVLRSPVSTIVDFNLVAEGPELLPRPDSFEADVAEIVGALLDGGASVDVADASGNLPIYFDPYNPRLLPERLPGSAVAHFVERLVATKHRQGRSVLSTGVVAWLGPSFDVAGWRNDVGQTVLVMAVVQRNWALATALRDAVPTEALDCAGRNWLHYAVECGAQLHVLEGIGVGAALDVSDKSGATPVDLAVRRCDILVVEFLLRHGLAVTEAARNTVTELIGPSTARADIYLFRLLGVNVLFPHVKRVLELQTERPASTELAARMELHMQQTQRQQQQQQQGSGEHVFGSAFESAFPVVGSAFVSKLVGGTDAGQRFDLATAPVAGRQLSYAELDFERRTHVQLLSYALDMEHGRFF